MAITDWPTDERPREKLLARGAGTIKPIVPELGREAHDWRLRPAQIALNFQYYARQVLENGDECLI